MIKLKKYFQFILTPKEKLNLLFCFGITIIIAVIETFGIGLIPGFIYSIMEPEKTIQIIENLTSLNFSYLSNFASINLYKLFALAVLVLYVFKNITLYVLSIIVSFIYLSIREGIGYRIPKWLVKLSYTDYLNHDLSEIIRNITTETVNATNCLREIILGINEILIIIFIIIFTSYSLPWHFITSLAFIGFVTFIFLLVVKSRVKKWGAQSVIQRNQIIKFTNHIFHSFKEIKIFMNEKFLLDKYKQSLSLQISLIKKLSFISLLSKHMIEVLAVTVILTSMIILLSIKINLTDHLVTLSFFAAALIKIMPGFYKLNSYYLKLQTNQKSVETIYNLKNQIINYKNLISKKNFIHEFSQSLEFKNVSFKYKSRNKTLENINFKINFNQITLITGRSGSGKSTLIDLICGLINADEGEILLNNKNIYSKKNPIKINISYMPQKIYLLNDTIKNNIVFQSNKNIDEIYLKKIIKDVGLDNFIDTLPNKLNEFIGENAKKISGGQIKRIGLARSLYKNKKTLILDEPTSGLDNKSSEELIELLKKLSFNKNILIVSHNKDFGKISDNILECKNYTVHKIK